MEEDEESTKAEKTLLSSSVRVTQKSVSSSVSVVQKTRVQSQVRSVIRNQRSVAEVGLCGSKVVPQCQIVTHQASGDSVDFEESEESFSEENKISKKIPTRYAMLNKSPNSSSSQEDYEPEIKHLGKTCQYLSAGTRVETARSMESLRTTHQQRSYLTSSDRDVRRSAESLDMKLKRRAISGDEMSLGIEEAISAERRRGLFAGSSVPQHLSLPPPANYLNLSPGDRRLTILSPHSPHHSQDMLQFSSMFSSRNRKTKKSIVLPRLVLPRSDSDISDVFFEHNLE